MKTSAQNATGLDKQWPMLAALGVFGIFAVWKLSFVLIILFVSFLLTLILLPFTRLLKRIKIPALFAVFIPIVIFLLIIFGLGFLVAPAVKEQLVQLSTDLPRAVNTLPFASELQLNGSSIREFLTEQRGGLGRTVLGIGQTIAHVLFGLVTVIVITVYWLSDYQRIKKTIFSFVPKPERHRAHDIWERLELKLGKWFLGQIMVSTAVGLMVWLAASLLGLPYAATLGVLAALLEILPTLGPILASVPAILLGADESFEKAIAVTIVYILVQQIESHLITPQVMGRTVKLHPIAIIVSFLVGSVLLGILGALLAVPIAIAFSSIVDSFRETPQGKTAAE